MDDSKDNALKAYELLNRAEYSNLFRLSFLVLCTPIPEHEPQLERIVGLLAVNIKNNKIEGNGKQRTPPFHGALLLLRY